MGHYKFRLITLSKNEKWLIDIQNMSGFVSASFPTWLNIVERWLGDWWSCWLQKISYLTQQEQQLDTQTADLHHLLSAYKYIYCI